MAFANVDAQILDPAKWTTKIERKSENTYLLTFDGTIEKDWHLYSQFTPDGGPLAFWKLCLKIVKAIFL